MIIVSTWSQAPATKHMFITIVISSNALYPTVQSVIIPFVYSAMNWLITFWTPLQGCDECTLVECLRCQTLTTCMVCNETADYFLNAATQLCEECPVEGCTICSTFSTCSVCDNSNDYFIVNQTCSKCSLHQCLDCNSLTECVQCNEMNDYFLNAGSC